MIQVIKTAQRAVKRAAIAVAVCLLALPGVSSADSVSTWTVNSDTTWTSTSGGTGDGLLTVTDWGQIGNGAVLNQTGGTIDLSNSQYGMIIAQTRLGTYNMSGNAIYLSDHVLLGNNASGTWTLTDTASVTISPANGQLGTLWFGRASEAADAGKSRYVLLSGAASFTVASLVFGKTDDDYISFATGCTATFTAGDKVLADYQALVAAGNIRVDGVVQTDFSKFHVTGTGGHTLSLAPQSGPVIIATGSPLSAMSTIQGTASTATPFSVSGSLMTAGITVTPPTGVEVSTTSATSGFAGSGTAITVGSTGTIAATTVWVRLAATAPVGTYNSQNIVLTSAGADIVNVTTATTGNNVTGAATKLAFTIQPGGGAAGAVWAAQPVVRVQDADGNTVDSSVSITLAKKSGTPTSGGPGTLSGTTTVSAVHGVAIFTGLSIDTLGAGYQLTATSAGLTSADSAAFGIAAQPPPSVLGNIMPMGDSITYGWPAAGGYRDPLYTLLANQGYTFTFVGSSVENSSPTLDAAGQTHHEGHGGFVIAAGTSGRSGLDENLATWIGPGGAAPDKILLMIGINDINSGYDVANAPTRLNTLIDHIYGYRPAVKLYVASITPQVGYVAAVQAFNATIPGIVASHQALGRNVFYVPMYDAININTDLYDGLHPNALGYQHMAQAWDTALNLTTTGVATTTTLTSSINPSTYSQQVIFTATVQTNSSTATDATGNFFFSVDGTMMDTVAVSGGSATYTNSTLATGNSSIRATYTGDGTYAASSVILTQTNNPGPATKLAFTTQPGGGNPGVVWATQPVVTVQDADGNTVDSSDSITLTITTGTPASGGPGTLSGTKTVSAVHGVATFSGLSIDTVGAGYQLTATSAGLATATSATFTVHVVADTRTTWSVSANTTWTSTSGSYGNGFLTVTEWGQIGNGAVFNQTGGTIDLSNSQYGMIIAQTSLGTYNMSGNAIYLSDHVLLGNNASGTWTLTDTASVTISPANGQLGTLWFGRASEAGDAGKSRYVLLSGAASFTVASLVFGKTDDDYISFATGSKATFTAGNKVLADYQALVAAGNIRIDGVLQTDFSKFRVTGTGGNTLSLYIPPQGTVIMFF